MKTKQSISVLTISFIILGICACANAQSTGIQNVEGQYTPTSLVEVADGCMQPPFIYKTRNKQPRQPIFSNLGWQFITNTSQDLSEKLISQDVMLTRIFNGQPEVWIRSVYSESDTRIAKYQIFYPQNKSFVEIPGLIKNHNGLTVLETFVLSDGSIWGQNFSFEDSDYVLSKFDEQEKEFKVVEGAQSPIISSINTPAHIVVGSDNIFWIFVDGDGIYNFDSRKNQTNFIYKLAANYYVRSAALSPDGKIYFTVMTYDSGSNYPKWGLLELSLRTLNVSPVDLTYSVIENPYIDPSNVYLDRSGRLWLGALGWREPGKNEWFKLSQSAIFITNSTESDYVYWQNPELLLDSADGKLWFRSHNGTAWMDIEKGEWCWFTTYQSNIVEDADHNLWMIADGKLYKYPLKP